MKRKLTEADSKILARAIKDNGAAAMAMMLLIDGGTKEVQDAGFRWTRRKLAALRFMNELRRDYTDSAILREFPADPAPQVAAALAKQPATVVRYKRGKKKGKVRGLIFRFD